MSSATPCAPSRTAALVAAYRARASREGRGLCNDPWAGALAGDLGTQLMDQFDALVPSMELLVAVRTAFFDDQVRFWTAESEVLQTPQHPGSSRRVDQVVVVGAGLDSRGARLRRPGLTFYEVDHPMSLQYKKQRVRELRGYAGDAIVYVACDLEQDDLMRALSATAFQPRQPAVFLCEGLLPYLSDSAVHRVLSGISTGCHASSIVVLDHVVSRPATEAVSSSRERLVLERLESLGEPLRFGRKDVLPVLHDAGFHHTHSICLEDVRESLTGVSDPAAALRLQHVTTGSRRSLPGSR